MRLEQAVRAAVAEGASSDAYMGTVTAIDSTALALTVDIGTGTPLTGVRWIASYTPAVDDFVVVLRVGHGWWVLGKNSKDLTDPGGAIVSSEVVPAYAAIGGVNHLDSPTWHWFASSIVAQGVTSSYISPTDTHAAVYLFPPLASLLPPGSTVLATKLRLTRDADDSGASPQTPVVRLHSYTGAPSGAPTWIGSEWRPGAVAVGQSAVWDLPSAWVTQLLAGSARGVGLYSTRRADYSLWLAGAQITITYSVPT